MNNTENESRQLTKDEIRSGKVSREEFRKLKQNPIYLVLDGLKSAHNVGTVIRLSDALLVDNVYLCCDQSYRRETGGDTILKSIFH